MQEEKRLSFLLEGRSAGLIIIKMTFLCCSSFGKSDTTSFLRSWHQLVSCVVVVLAIALTTNHRSSYTALAFHHSNLPIQKIPVPVVESNFDKNDDSSSRLEQSHFPQQILHDMDVSNPTSRRRWLQQGAAIAIITAASNIIIPTKVVANAAETGTTGSAGTLSDIQDATTTLQTLLDNWKKAVVDCTYADVPRELLSQENKAELLEKASTFALFDKSVSVTSCKTTNRIVRDYLGVTGKGPVVGIDKTLRKVLNEYDIDDLDTYVQLIEDVQQSLAKANSFSYSASSDFSSLNNFQEEDATKILSSGSSNLQQCRACIQSAVDGLNKIITILNSSTKSSV